MIFFAAAAGAAISVSCLFVVDMFPLNQSLTPSPFLSGPFKDITNLLKLFDCCDCVRPSVYLSICIVCHPAIILFTGHTLQKKNGGVRGCVKCGK